MKTINKTKLLQGAVILGVILTGLTIARLDYNNNVLEAKLEIAEQPSQIEIQKQELTELEFKWRSKQKYLEVIEELKETTIQEKLETEKLIHAKRNELLGN